MVSLEVMPWFSPAVSPEISRVMHNLVFSFKNSFS